MITQIRIPVPHKALRNSPVLKEMYGNFYFLSDKKTTPTAKDYHVATDANFEEITEVEFNSIKAPIFESKSNSKYKIKDGVVYRLSSHWGNAATCRWALNGMQYNAGVRYGKIALKDMKRNDFAIINSIKI